MSHITITLYADERSALVRLAEIERRDPRAQAALIIRNELRRSGLLPASEPTSVAAISQPAESRHADAE